VECLRPPIYVIACLRVRVIAVWECAWLRARTPTTSSRCVLTTRLRITPMVVVPTCAPEWISRSLDSGAQAVNDVVQAKMCVDAAKFPPMVSGVATTTRIVSIIQPFPSETPPESISSHMAAWLLLPDLATWLCPP
jgi:hypothetical protein